MNGSGSPLDRPLRVAVIAACPFPFPRGTPIRVHRLSTALVARGHEIHVFTYHLGQKTERETLPIHRSIRVPTYNKVSPGPSYQKLLVVDPLLTATVRSGLTKHRFDVIHAHHHEGLLVGKAASLGRGIPLVFDAHTLLASELPYFQMGFTASFRARLGGWLDASLPRLADHVVPVTNAIKGKLVQYGCAEDRITVVPNGVEHEVFDIALAAAPARHPSTLMFAGNLASYQGIEPLLRSFARIVEKRSDVRLQLLTESSFEPYEALASGLGVREHVEIIPAPFSEQPALLARATVALNPRTDCDGIPQKLLNYMAAGCATVSFEGSAPCVEHAKTGWTVKNGDTDAFAAGVLALLENPPLAQRLGQQARQAVLEQHSWEAAAEKIELVYHRLLASADGAGRRPRAGRSAAAADR